MTDSATTLDRLAARAGQLYSLPAVAMKVLELTNNPSIDVRALKDCIENDPALTSKILRVVNSSLFGLSRQVSDLNQALALLGTKPLKLLVLGFSLPGGLFAGVSGEVLGQYWRHTLTKAVAGRELSETLWKVRGDDAFIAGLLQDLGMLLLIQELGEPYVKFLTKVLAGGKDLAALETESMGFDHATLTARMLSQWGLPEPLVDAVAWKPDGLPPEGAARGPQALPQILYLSELLARLLADRQPGVLGELLDLGRQDHGLSEAKLETLVERLEEKARQLADVLSLQLPEGLDYRDVLVQAHAQLSQVAFDAAGELSGKGAKTLSADAADELLLEEMQGMAEAVADFSDRRAESSRPPAATAAEAPATVTVATVARPVQEFYPAATSVAASTLTDDPVLIEQLQSAVAACRQSRCALSLMLVELDRLDELSATRSARDFSVLRQLVEAACQAIDHRPKLCSPYGKAGFALILVHCERREAVELATRLIDEVHRQVGDGRRQRLQPVTLSVGVAAVALPPKNFPPQDLLHGARRCLYGSHASGGGVVKSLEVY